MKKAPRSRLSRKRWCVLLLCVGMILSFPQGVPAQGIVAGEALSLSQAVELGLKNHPNIMAATSNIRIGEARIGEARAGYYPQANLGETYNRVGPVGSSSSSRTQTGSGTTGGATSTGSYDQYSTTASVTQTIFDFGKTSSQVKIQNLNTDSARSDLENVRDQVVFNIKQAYFNLLQAERNRDVAKETVNQFQVHLTQARGFYEVGTKPRFDMTKAEVDLSNAKVSLIKGENQVRLARLTLNNAMGIPEAPAYSLLDSLSSAAYELTYEESLKRAFSQRSDLQSLVRKREAAKESINLMQKGYLPVLAGSANYYYSGTGFPLDNGWTAGVNLTFPLFSGFLTKYQVLEAISTRDVLTANELSLKQDILLQVHQAYLNLGEAGERIVAAEVGVRQGKENLELAMGRYQAGVGSPVEVTDSVVALSNAQVNHTAALYDYKVAVASIEKAMGGR